MIIPTVAIFYASIVLLAVAVLIFAVWIPKDFNSLFRYRLWKLRDAVVDDTLSDQLDDAPVVRSFVSTVESAIAGSNEVSFLWHLVRPRYNEEIRQENRLWLARGLKELPKDQRRRMISYFCEFNSAVSKRIFFGCPSGWIAIALLAIFCFLVAVVMSVVLSVKYGVTNPIRLAIRHCQRIAREVAISVFAFDNREQSSPVSIPIAAYA